MSALNIVALVVFAICWLAYAPILRAFARQQRGSVLNTDLTVIRASWMANMARRKDRFMDGQLLGHALSSASFFASSNLILIAAAAGALFGGERTFASVSALELVRTSSRFLFELQLGLILVTLSRGLLDFMWAIRQLNYCLAAVGAAPTEMSEEEAERYGDAAARLINPALSSFNAGVRGYYFALAVAAWLFGPGAFLAITVGAMLLLFWRQRSSTSAAAVRDLRDLLENRPR